MKTKCWRPELLGEPRSSRSRQARLGKGTLCIPCLPKPSRGDGTTSNPDAPGPLQAFWPQDAASVGCGRDPSQLIPIPATEEIPLERGCLEAFQECWPWGGTGVAERGGREVVCSRIDLDPKPRAQCSHGPDAWLWRNQEVTGMCLVVPGQGRLCVCVCMCVCVHVCVRERERGRERETGLGMT